MRTANVHWISSESVYWTRERDRKKENERGEVTFAQVLSATERRIDPPLTSIYILLAGTHLTFIALLIRLFAVLLNELEKRGSYAPRNGDLTSRLRCYFCCRGVGRYIDTSRSRVREREILDNFITRSIGGLARRNIAKRQDVKIER